VVYLELIYLKNVDSQDRAHFFAVSAQIMRHILLDPGTATAWRLS
jgi:hypothetical protein